MSLFKLDLDTQTFIIVITSIIWAMNFRFTFNNINYHMDIGNYCSLKYDPFLILIKNILCIFYFLPYFIELKLNKINISQQNLNIENNENDENENLDEIEAKIVPNQLNNNNKKNFFVLKILLFLIFIYFSEEIYFIISNNHVLDRTVCPTRNMFTLIAILIFSPILSKKKIDKAQIKNFLNYNRHQIIPLIIIFLLSLFIMLYNPLKIERFKDLYNINLLIYVITYVLMGLELVIIKYLIEVLYINKFLILGIKGLFGTLVFIIINKTITKNDFYNFFDELLSFQYDLGNEDFNLSFKIFYVLTSCILPYLKIILINKFSEMHFLSTLMITDIIYFPFYCIERFAIQKFRISTKDTFYINVSVGVINTILMLIFNEILELNFWGCNKYLRKNIIRRERKESKESNHNLLALFNDDENSEA